MVSKRVVCILLECFLVINIKVYSVGITVLVLNCKVLAPALNQCGSCFENSGCTTIFVCFFLVTDTFNTNMHDLFIMAPLGDGGDVVCCGREMLGPYRLARCRLGTDLPATGNLELFDHPSGAAVVNIGGTPCLALSYRWVILFNQFNNSFRKVTFSQVSVCPRGGVSLVLGPFQGGIP